MTTPTTVNIRLQLRADTAANWAAANPTLLANEVGLETDTKKLKVGSGSTAWNSLAYFPSIVSGGTVLGNLEIGSTGTLTFEGSTADGFETTLAVTNPTADRTITLPNQSGTVVVSGNASIVNADIAANAEIAVSKLANGTANQVIVTDGTNVSWSDDLTLAGNLTVNGTTTTISTQNLLVEDKNIIIGDVATPTDTTADGGGITLKGATDKTINWVDSTDAWTSSERFSVPLGSAASPSLTFTGDENSGLYSPGADQVAISTNGTGRLFVDASGRILVGPSSTSPTTTATLILQGSSAGSTAQSVLRMAVGTLTPGASDSLATIVFADSSHTTAARISAFRDGGTWTSSVSQPTALLFATTPDASATAVERLRITSAGLVGIGTSAPLSPLHVLGGIRFGVVAPSTGGQGAMYNDGDGIALEAFSGNNSTIKRNIYLAPYGGNVGIGTTAPGAPLDVRGGARIYAEAGAGIGIDIPGRASDNASIIRFLNNAFSAELGRIVHNGADFAFNNTSNNAVTFATNNSEKARIDSSGRLLVGTSSAPTVLAVVSKFNVAVGDEQAATMGRWSANEYGPVFVLAKSRSSSVGTSTIVQNGDYLGSIYFAGADGINLNSSGASIAAFVDGTPGANDMPGRLVFSTTADGASSPTERMRIKSDGVTSLLSPGTVLTPSSIAAAGTTAAFIYARHSATTFDNGTNSFTVWTNGNVQNTNNSYGAISDAKLKENIVDATSQWNDIKALQVRKYNFKEGQTHTQIGLIAQEVEQVSPGLVTESPDRDAEGNDLGTVTKSVNYSVLYMKAVKALQEAMERIEILEAKVAALESA